MLTFYRAIPSSYRYRADQNPCAAGDTASIELLYKHIFQDNFTKCFLYSPVLRVLLFSTSVLETLNKVVPT